MYDWEKETDISLTFAQRQEISMVTGSTIAEINAVARDYMYKLGERSEDSGMKTVHQILLMRKYNGEPMPASYEDLQTMMQRDQMYIASKASKRPKSMARLQMRRLSQTSHI